MRNGCVCYWVHWNSLRFFVYRLYEIPIRYLFNIIDKSFNKNKTFFKEGIVHQIYNYILLNLDLSFYEIKKHEFWKRPLLM